MALEPCSRCVRERHEKCLDRGYWASYSDEEEQQCGCNCWLQTDIDEMLGLEGQLSNMRHRIIEALGYEIA